jgi:hypothetical protein
MGQRTNETPSRGGLIAAAAAGLTLAAGVTLGGLLGWIRPPQAAMPAAIEAPSAGAVEESAPPPAPTPEPARFADPAAEPEIEPVVVALERSGRHHEEREHHGKRERGASHEREGRDDDD